MLLVKPFLGCNRNCKYCFEGDYRQDNPPKMDHEIKLVLDSMEANLNGNRLVCLHGGEPLMLPKSDIEQILKKGYQLTSRIAIQTNAFLLDDEHMELFKKYNTSVGISYDGFGNLNEARMNQGEAKEIWQKVKRLIEKGIRTSLIVVVSRANAGTPNRLQRLKQFLIEARKLGTTRGRLNPCDHPDWMLDKERLVKVYRDLAVFTMVNGLLWGPFTDIWNALRHRGPVVCTFNDCDPFHTRSATVILGDGSVTNCIKMAIQTNFIRHAKATDMRSQILLSKPEEEGGCQGCSWWDNCHGGCPAAAIDKDWRNRTIFCSMYKAMFGLYRNVQRWGDRGQSPLNCSQKVTQKLPPKTTRPKPEAKKITCTVT